MTKTTKNEKISIYPILTRNCNFRCQYCETYKERDAMTPQVARRLCVLLEHSLQSLEQINIFFMGGEPLLKFSLIKDINESLKIRGIRHRFNPIIITNGALLNREMAAYIRGNNIGVNLSFDGDAETQNYNRPSLSRLRSSYDQVVENLKFLDLKRWGRVHVSALMTFHPRTVSYLFKNFLHLLKLGFVNFSFSPAVSAKDAWQWEEKDLQLFKENFEKVQGIILKLGEKGLRINLPPLPEERDVDLAHWIGNEKFGIDVNGDIYATDIFLLLPPEERRVLIIGNIFKNKDLLEIYRNRKSPEFIGTALTRNGRYLEQANRDMKSLKLRDKILRNAQHK